MVYENNTSVCCDVGEHERCTRHACDCVCHRPKPRASGEKKT